MTIGNQTIDLDALNKEELDIFIKEARKIRERMTSARKLMADLNNVLSAAEQENFRFCNRYTGKILVANEWLVYDEETECPREGEWFP